jgi:hypothetical protein
VRVSLLRITLVCIGALGYAVPCYFLIERFQGAWTMPLMFAPYWFVPVFIGIRRRLSIKQHFIILGLSLILAPITLAFSAYFAYATNSIARLLWFGGAAMLIPIAYALTAGSNVRQLFLHPDVLEELSSEPQQAPERHPWNMWLFLLLGVVIGAWLELAAGIYLNYNFNIAKEDIAYLKNECARYNDGNIEGKWPLVANGFLFNRVNSEALSNPIEYTYSFQDRKFKWMEYSREALASHSYSRPLASQGDRDTESVAYSKAFARFELQQRGHPDCEVFEEHRDAVSQPLSNEMCIALTEFDDPALLWSQLEFNNYQEIDQSGPQTIDWNIREVVGRQSAKALVSVRSFHACISQDCDRGKKILQCTGDYKVTGHGIDIAERLIVAPSS